jgi:hypothetical protein
MFVATWAVIDAVIFTIIILKFVLDATHMIEALGAFQ